MPRHKFTDAEREALLGCVMTGETITGCHIEAEAEAREYYGRVRELANLLIERYSDIFDPELLGIAFGIASRRLSSRSRESWHVAKTITRRIV